MPPKVLIVGGGIGGLTAAISLKRVGVDVAIAERSESIQEIGAGITIQANAMAIFNALGIVIPAEDACSIGSFQMVNVNGRVLMAGNSGDVEIGAPSINVHRFDLQAALLKQAKKLGIRCQFASELTSFESSHHGVKAQFHDGSHVECDLLIGADGVHSAVRQTLLGHSTKGTRYSGQTCWRFAIQAPDLVPKITTERWLPGRRVGIVPLSRGRVYVYLVKNAPQGSPAVGSTKPDVLRKDFAEIDGKLDAIFERLDETTSIHHGDLFDRPRIHFGDKRVLLIGDAAHLITPNMGQGAGMAIEDAATLALLSVQLAGNLNQWAARLAEMRTKRVREILKTSWRIGKIAHIRNPAVCCVRDFMLSKILPPMTRGQAKRMLAPGIEIASALNHSQHK